MLTITTMSIIFENSKACFISHKKYIDSLYNNIDCKHSFQLKEGLFEILTPYKHARNILTSVSNSLDNQLELDANYVKETYEKFSIELMKHNILHNSDSQIKSNKFAQNMADQVYYETTKHKNTNFFGANPDTTTVKEINATKYLFPKNCQFYAFDILDIEKHLSGKKYDLILLDPPWWNKYIRRKRKKCDFAYQMMYNEDLKKIPVNKLLKDNGLIVVWCTNSPQHLNSLINDVFKKWNVEFVTKWFWLKVTKFGEPICGFSKPPGKQPFEQIIIAGKTKLKEEDRNKVIVSCPSAIHSHKPPLVEVLKKYLPENAECLELFARYLLPNWTSYGNEVIKLQHESLFDVT